MDGNTREFFPLIEWLRHYMYEEEKQETVIIANGPSLKLDDLLKIDRDETLVIGLNRIYLDYTPDILVCVNPLLLEQWGEEIIAVDCIKILPEMYVEKMEELGNFQRREARIIPIDTTGSHPDFNPDLRYPIWEGHTVTFVALQLANWMGGLSVKLIGLDHYFGILTGDANQEARMTGDDLGHYRTDYFPPGSRWNLPDLKSSEYAYLRATKYMQIFNYSRQTRWRGFCLENPNTFSLIGRNHPRVSAIVSAYHSRKYFKGCLEDLMAQSLWMMQELEIVVICKKGSYEDRMVSKFENKERIKVVRTEGIPNVYEAWNLGIGVATGKYFTNANTDDRLMSDAYEIMANALDQMPHVDLVYANSFVTWKPNQTYDEFLAKYAPEDLVPGRQEKKPGVFAWPEYSRAGLTAGCYIGPHPMWRANVHQRHGLFDPMFESAGDWDFWLRIAQEDNFYHIGAVLGLYFANPKGVELGNSKRAAKEARLVIEKHQESSIGIHLVDSDTVRLQLGDKFIQSNIEELTRLVTRIHQLGTNSTLEPIRSNGNAEVKEIEVN